MNKNEALSLLLLHLPLPPDREMTKEAIQKFDQARRFFLAQPDTDCIRPFLNSLGEGDGLGIYPLIGDVFRKLPKESVVGGLVESLKSPLRSVRYWSTQLASEFPSPELTPQLLTLLKEDDYDLKYAALTAIEQSANRNAVPQLVEFLKEEADEELRSLAKEVADGLLNR